MLFLINKIIISTWAEEILVEGTDLKKTMVYYFNANLIIFEKQVLIHFFQFYTILYNIIYNIVI